MPTTEWLNKYESIKLSLIHIWHYRLFTYDDVYNIIAVSYEFAAEL